MKLLTCPDPLERAVKFLQPLTTLPESQKNIEVWIAVYDVAIRRGVKLNFFFFRVLVEHCYVGKRLQAVQALFRARALDAENPDLHVRIVHARQLGSSFFLFYFFTLKFTD